MVISSAGHDILDFVFESQAGFILTDVGFTLWTGFVYGLAGVEYAWDQEKMVFSGF
jgi:hypothetical protein